VFCSAQAHSLLSLAFADGLIGKKGGADSTFDFLRFGFLNRCGGACILVDMLECRCRVLV
jgi:hypothetical protein